MPMFPLETWYFSLKRSSTFPRSLRHATFKRLSLARLRSEALKNWFYSSESIAVCRRKLLAITIITFSSRNTFRCSLLKFLIFFHISRAFSQDLRWFYSPNSPVLHASSNRFTFTRSDYRASGACYSTCWKSLSSFPSLPSKHILQFGKNMQMKNRIFISKKGGRMPRSDTIH